MPEWPGRSLRGTSQTTAAEGGAVPLQFVTTVYLIVLKLTGFLLARLPVFFLRGLSWTLGSLLYHFPSERNRTVRSNLHHAFSGKSRAALRRIGLESCRRTIEMGLFAMILPFLGERRLRQCLSLADFDADALKTLLRDSEPAVVLLPHIGSAEAVTLFPLVCGEKPARLGAIYRPFDNPALEKWIRETREKFGVELFSRKEGFRRSIELLRGGGSVGILFDQNAGSSGSLLMFLDRLASATDLPDLLARRFNAALIGIYPRRTGFLRSELVIERLTPASNAPGGVTLAANQWLETLLADDENLCASWLWLHNRWKTQSKPRKRFRLDQKRSHLELQKQLQRWKELPRETRFWIRMPDCLEEIITTLPLLKALRRSRPDACLTAVAAEKFRPLLKGFGLVDDTIRVPPRGRGYYRQLFMRRRLYPDTYILLNDSFRADLEAWLSRCPQRFGIRPRGKSRPLLTHTWKPPADPGEAGEHRLRTGETFLRSFGMEGELDLSPLPYHSPATSPREPRLPERLHVGLICHAGGTQEGPWPTDRWQELIRRLLETPPALEILLLGTAADRQFTGRIEETFPHEPVINLAGKTTLDDLVGELQRCRVVAGTDCGELHLANALGLPTVGLFGPGNPLRSGLVFDAPVTLVQPEGCPPAGGGSTGAIEVDAVFEALHRLL